jgi:hypothetical protein
VTTVVPEVISLDPLMVEHPKIRRLSAEAFRLYMRAVFYSFRCRTDGLVDEAMLRELATLRRWRRLVDELRDAALIHEVPGGWEIHDYLDHQPSRQEVDRFWAVKRARRRADRDRKRVRRRGSENGVDGPHDVRSDPPHTPPQQQQQQTEPPAAAGERRAARGGG